MAGFEIGMSDAVFTVKGVNTKEEAIDKLFDELALLHTKNKDILWETGGIFAPDDGRVYTEEEAEDWFKDIKEGE